MLRGNSRRSLAAGASRPGSPALAEVPRWSRGKGRPLVSGKVMQRSVGVKLDPINVSTCSYIAPGRLDTPLGRCRNFVVTQGVDPPGE